MTHPPTPETCEDRGYRCCDATGGDCYGDRMRDAAPALLLALQECVRQFEADPSSLTSMQCRALRLARAAIAKAVS